MCKETLMSPAAGRRRLARHAQGKVLSVSATRVQTPLYADCRKETGSNCHSFRRGVSAADTIGCALSKNQLASCVRYSTDGRQQNVKNRTQCMVALQQIETLYEHVCQLDLSKMAMSAYAITRSCSRP